MPILKRKVGRPKKVEGESNHIAVKEESVKNATFLHTYNLKSKAKFTKSKTASLEQLSKRAIKKIKPHSRRSNGRSAGFSGQVNKASVKKCSPMRKKIIDTPQSSNFLQSKKILAKKYKKLPSKTRKKSLRSAYSILKVSSGRALRSQFSPKQQQALTVNKRRNKVLQSLKEKQAAAIAKIKDVESDIPVSHLTPVVELDTDDVLSSAWLPLAERQPLSEEKRMMFRGCDPHHKCCQQRAVEMFDNCTQWEDPAYLYKMLSASSPRDQASASTSSASTGTGAAVACGQLILNQNPETGQASQAFTVIEQAPGQHQLLLLQNIPSTECSPQAAPTQSHNFEVSHQERNEILFQSLQDSGGLEHGFFPQEIKTEKKAFVPPKKRRRKRKSQVTKPSNSYQCKNHMNLTYFTPETGACSWGDNSGSFSSVFENHAISETDQLKNNQFVHEPSSCVQHESTPNLSPFHFLSTTQLGKTGGSDFEQQSKISTTQFHQGGVFLCDSKQKSFLEESNVFEPIKRVCQNTKVDEPKLLNSQPPAVDLSNSKTFFEVNKNALLHQLALSGSLSSQQLILIPQNTQQALSISNLSQDNSQQLCVPKHTTQGAVTLPQTSKPMSLLQMQGPVVSIVTPSQDQRKIPILPRPNIIAQPAKSNVIFAIPQNVQPTAVVAQSSGYSIIPQVPPQSTLTSQAKSTLPTVLFQKPCQVLQQQSKVSPKSEAYPRLHEALSISENPSNNFYKMASTTQTHRVDVLDSNYCLKESKLGSSPGVNLTNYVNTIVSNEIGSCKAVQVTAPTTQSPSHTISSLPLAQQAILMPQYCKDIPTLQDTHITTVPQNCIQEEATLVACSSASYTESDLNYPTLSQAPGPVLSVIVLDSDCEAEADQS
ncbi:hypothetical protein ElyMa_006728400 [Elysia marginata]|uniref:Uncharacterized protein n=1 Tax=Elysia marginata TaxID=1093978 RepID=A0AAV4IT21_9GAST|nr:hypothetical protein ElyMa_006728400 [Elysia marginata]